MIQARVCPQPQPVLGLNRTDLDVGCESAMAEGGGAGAFSTWLLDKVREKQVLRNARCLSW